MPRLLRLLATFVLIGCVAACGAPRRAGPNGPGAFASFGDSAPHPWRGRTPYSLPVHGIDISRWQGDIDWNRVRGSGVSFAYLKATEGADHYDPEFRRYWREAGAARIPRGAYHYYYFCRSGVQQAAWFIANVPRERGAMPPVLDIEWTHSKTCPRRPSPVEIRREAMAFMSALEQYYGQRPIVYTTVDFYRDNNLGSWNEEFWLRSVADAPSGPYPRQRWSFWQYTGTGIVPGISGNVDLNAFTGSVGAWRSWLNRRLQ